MSNIDKKLEAFSLMRMLPPGAAQVGDVTRQELRDADLGSWVAPCGRTDDLSALVEPAASSPEEPRLMEDFDEVLPKEPAAAKVEGTVVIMRFKAG